MSHISGFVSAGSDGGGQRRSSGSRKTWNNGRGGTPASVRVVSGQEAITSVHQAAAVWNVTPPDSPCAEHAKPEPMKRSRRANCLQSNSR
jgi:hypothetical protein